METSFSEVFNGDIADDADPKQPSELFTPGSDTLGSQPASSRQPQPEGAAAQAGRASMFPFSQVRPGLNTPHPNEGPSQES